MEVQCLALKDLTSPRKSFSVGAEEDGGRSEQKVKLVSGVVLSIADVRLCMKERGLSQDGFWFPMGEWEVERKWEKFLVS